MDWAWRFGMIIVAGIPAIVGGGVFWSLFQKWTPVIIWEIVLLFIMSILISKGGKETGGHHQE